MELARVRGILVVLLGAILLSVVMTGATAAQASADCEYIGTIEGTAGPELAEQAGWEADDPYDSEVYHCPDGALSGDFVRGRGGLAPSENGTGEIYLSETFYTESAYVIYHERGHNMGYNHEGGIMDYDQPDADPSRPLAGETEAIAEHTEGLRYVDWSDDDSVNMLSFVAREFAHGNTTAEELGYAARRWSEGEGEDVYADNTIVAELEGDLPSYDADEFDRSVSSNGFYRNESTDSGDPWW